jgi:signal transduction histidine kinase
MLDRFDLFSEFLLHNIHGKLYLIASCISLALGFFVLSKDWKSNVSRSFFLITFTGAIWLLWYALLTTALTNEQAYRWLGLGYILAVPYISPSVYLFSINWLGIKNKKMFVYIGFVSAFILGLTMLIYADRICVFRDMPWGKYNYYQRTWVGMGYYAVLLLMFMAYAFMAFQNLWAGFQNAVSFQKKNQFKYFLIGFLTGYTGLVDFLVSGGLNLYPFGYISFTLFILIIAYATIRHQLFDVKIVLRRLSLILAIYFILFLLILPVIFPFLNQVLKSSANPKLLILGIGLFSGLIFSFGPFIYAGFVRRSYWLRGHLATGLTHELKSPLSSIQSAIEIILADLKNPASDKTKSIEYADMIRNNSERLELFIKDLLNVARNEEAIRLDKSYFDFSDLINNEANNYRPLAALKGISIQIQSNENFFISADKPKIQQVISNLLSNAIKFSAGGTIRIETEKTDNSIRCSISDQGCGISAKNIDRIFDKFFQEHPSAKGTGIGLTIAKMWVEAHGGKIWAESEGEGDGTKTTFFIREY